MIYGYIRPIYYDETGENQRKELQDKCDRLFQEKHGSPKKREQLEEMLMEVKIGDTIMVERMSVLADTTRELVELLKVCEKDEVSIHFLYENIVSRERLDVSFLEIMEHFVDFQTDIVKQSTKMGMKRASKQGKTVGRPRKPDANVQRAIAMYDEGYRLIDIKQETGISKSTLYRYLEEVGEREESHD